MHDEQQQPAITGTWGSRLSRAAFVLLMVQFGAVLATYLAVHAVDLSTAIRIYGPREALAGATVPFRVDAINRHTGSLVQMQNLDVTVSRTDGIDPGTIDAGALGEAGWMGTWRSPGSPGDHAVTFTVSAAEVEDLPLRMQVVTRPSTDPAFEWAGAPGLVPGRVRTSIVQPAELVAQNTADDCPIRISAGAPMGHAPGFVSSPVHIRFIGEAGQPADALSVDVTLPDATARTLRTNAAGVITVDARFADAGAIQLDFPCGGGRGSRQVRLAPTQVYHVLTPVRPLQPLGEPVRLVNHQSRSGDDWQLGLCCDGVWVHGSSHVSPATPEYAFSVDVGYPHPGPDGILVCSIHHMAWWSPNPARTTSWVVLFEPEIGRIAALQALIRLARTGAPTMLQPFLTELDEAAVPAWDEGVQEEFTRWVLGVLPRTFEPMPVLHDGIPEVVAELVATRGAWLVRLRIVLASEALLMLAYVLGLLLPGALADRQRFREFGLDDEATPDETAASRNMSGAWLQLVLTVAMVATFLLGLGILLGLLG
jgi:hypothetical protein